MSERPADPSAATVRTLSYSAAVLEAIEQAMEIDRSVLVMGVGADDPVGTRGATGLVEKFGKTRVVGTPLSEDGMTGVAIGAAMAGMRPVQVHGRVDFAMLAMNQLVNVAAKARYMYGGAASVPLTVRATIGRSWGQGAQHSQGLQSFFAHVPGLRVVMPSSPRDAKAAMGWALSASMDPVVFIDHRMLHKTVGGVPEERITCSPDSSWRVLGYGRDITIVALSYMVLEAERAAEHLKGLGISCSLFDPVWLRPCPCLPAVAEDVSATRRLLVVDCGWTTYGFSAEVVASVTERLSSGEGFQPAKRVSRMGFADTVCPTSKALERLYYPTAETIAAKAYKMVTGQAMPPWETGASPETSEFRGPF